MISDLKEFEKFLKICRKQGVSDVSLNGVSVKLGPPPRVNGSEEVEEPETPDTMTPDELMYYHLQNPGGNQ